MQDIRGKCRGVSFCLNERSRRIWAATEARSYGWGGITVVSEATGIDPKTIRKGLLEWDDLESLVEPLSRGDLQSPLRWTCKNTYKLSNELKKMRIQPKILRFCNYARMKGNQTLASKRLRLKRRIDF